MNDFKVKIKVHIEMLLLQKIILIQGLFMEILVYITYT